MSDSLRPSTGSLSLLPGVTGALTADGGAQSAQAGAKGQNIYMSFNAALGDNLELTFSNMSVANGTNNQLEVYVYGPSGNQVADYYCYTSDFGGTCAQHFWNLTAGTYTIVVTPSSSGGQIGFTAQVNKNTSGPALAMGGTVDVGLALGEVKRFTFHGDAGATVALQLSGAATQPAGGNVKAFIYRPDVGAITPGNYYTYVQANGSSLLNLQNLPVSGDYTVVVMSDSLRPSTGSLSLSQP
jgi:hypothetical protein